ncbi:SMI1/KNR4 family protein [Streptomyces sp. NPDC058855]|uniref:SMI1/KNR4 family protein n=1 Tax=Streptomyces sp. NPDC058855 TaxID=3346651 RepID=UPI0036B9A254
MARFDEVKARFWDEGPCGSASPVTEEAVEEAEHRLGVRLPASLLELLRAQDGGLVAEAWNAFPTGVPTSWSADHVPFDELRGIGRYDGRSSLLDSAYLIAEWGLPTPLVLLSGDGHTWIALDYRSCGERGEPSVTWFDEEDAMGLPLAADFRSFVERLAPAASFDHDDAARGG